MKKQNQKHKFLKAVVAVALIMFQVVSISAQDEKTYVIKDVEGWTKATIDFEVHKKLEIGLSESVRLEHNSSQLSQFFTEVYFNYSPIKRFDLGIGTRFIERKKEDELEPNIRFFTYAAYKQKIDRFSIKYRLKYQNTNELGKSNSEGDELIHHLRVQTSFAYNIKNWKLDPKLSVELYNRFDKEDGADFDKIRLKFGSEYEFKKAGSLGFFFGYERELAADYAKNTSIVGLQYNFEVKKKKKDK